MTGWQYTKLGRIADFKNGLNYSKENFGRGIKVIGVSDFQDYNFPNYASLQEINPNGVVRDEDLLSEGDMVFVRSNGNPELIGRCLYIKNLTEKVSHSGFTIRLRFSNRNIERLFFLYYFKSSILRGTLSLYGGGTNINNLNQGILNSLNIPLPPRLIQRKIAAVLSAYDDLIENNKRRIAILEKMAEELYREWFVRLRFPGHEKVKIAKGVPEGWEPIKLGEIVNFTMGQSPSSEFYNETGEGLPFNQGVGTYGERFPKRVIFCSVKGRLANKGDILFSVRAPVGRLNIADCKMIIGRGLAAMRHKKDFQSYLFYLLKVSFSDEDIIGNGAIFNSVGKDELKGFTILSPDKLLIEKYDKMACQIDKQIAVLFDALDKLTKTRDLLLSRLMSGKIDVEKMDIGFPASMREEREEHRKRITKCPWVL